MAGCTESLIVYQLDQTVRSADMRIDFPISPRGALEGYFQPFIAVGDDSCFMEYKRSESDDLVVYDEADSTIDENSVVDSTGGSNEDAFSLYDPDFNYKALVGTLICRWESSP